MEEGFSVIASVLVCGSIGWAVGRIHAWADNHNRRVRIQVGRDRFAAARGRDG